MSDWLEVAEWDWVLLGGGRRLHAVAQLTNEATVDDDWYGVGFTECARGGEMSIPGVLSRMSVPRCKRCCERRGLPVGDGSPKNDDACRSLVEKRLAQHRAWDAGAAGRRAVEKHSDALARLSDGPQDSQQPEEGR